MKFQYGLKAIHLDQKFMNMYVLLQLIMII